MLQCWVHGDDVDCIFPIEIPLTKTVGFLKELIKDKNPVGFHAVDVKDLTLHGILFSETEDLAHKLDNWTPNCNSRLAPQSKVLKCFPGSNDQQWLIIIDIPTSGAHLSWHPVVTCPSDLEFCMLATAVIQPSVFVPDMTLNCWMCSTSIENVFPIRISGTETIGFLKKAIKNENAVCFHDVDANNLTLYKVSMPWNNDLVWTLENQGFQQALPPLEILSDVFSDPDKKDVHIVVEASLSGGSIVWVAGYNKLILCQVPMQLHWRWKRKICWLHSFTVRAPLLSQE